ncbi:molecular chaperone DnaK [Pseudoclavibacter sp. AY1F1]|uniref:TraR/DksA family transcriptional regulator n=1 Tax=Pseudoclavibacter sp. AY1F1 TaxID=2080583 RepID=UPI000CE7A4E4|nr:TraR/DksA C4-type zinc finger protein [Pseudoclavibacter sp. AY1F1]PPF46974.1 molecular chaperone DnaK [Pseudoclavibacter sp. AY1F1]
MGETDGKRERAKAGDAGVYAERLENQRAVAVDRLARSEAALSALVRDRSSLNDDDEHDPDGAPLSTEWSRLAGQVEASKSELQRIEAALLRLENDTYGICIACGRPIPEVRLRVRPFAETCVACADLPRRSAR